MADPLTLLIIGGILAVTGTAVSTGVVAHQANESRKYQQEVLDKQRLVAEENAALARQQADVKAWEVKRQAHRFRATQLTKMGASGVGMEGNFLDLVGQSAADQEWDILNTKYEGKLTARQHMIQAMGAQDQIDLLDKQMQNPWLESGIAGATTAGSTMFSIAGSGVGSGSGGSGGGSGGGGS